MPEIKERPILFSAPMVRAILEGRKTVTRRALNERALKNIGYGVQLGECHELPNEGPLHPNSIGYYNDFCPFGQPGDRLWVRETWFCDHDEVMRGPYLKPDDLDIAEARDDGTLVYAADGLTPYEAEQPVWKPSIHMPRWASRILLEITAVRVERLQDISRSDIRAEGLECPPELASDDASPNYRDWYPAAWRELWESTGGNWDANPWVWVVEFKQVQAVSGCGYERGDWECREGGFMFDAGSGEGWDPQDETHICPHCRTRDYLDAAKDDAESCSKWTDCGSSGTGLDIWAGAESHALIANESEARKALGEIGVVGALVADQSPDGYSVVLCNTQQVTP